MSTDPIRGEERLIQEFLAPLAAGYPGAFGLKDDCAAFSPTAGHDLIVKTDPVAAGVHFFSDDAPEDIAWKALAFGLGDLAEAEARGGASHRLGWGIVGLCGHAPDHSETVRTSPVGTRSTQGNSILVFPKFNRRGTTGEYPGSFAPDVN